MTHLREQYWIMEVPENGFEFEICPDECGDFVIAFKSNSWLKENQYEVRNLPPGTWEIVCTSLEVTESNALGIVDSSEWRFPERHIRYVDYAHPFDTDNKQAWSVGFSNATDSLNSLLASKGCDINKNYLILKKVA